MNGKIGKTLHLFNPEHDLALGHGGEYYEAPASARRMGDELSTLPAWLASPGDLVCVPASVEAWSRRLPVDLPVDWVCRQEEAPVVEAVRPWGWDKAVIRQMRTWGISEACLPSPTRLERIRYGSSRLRAVEVLAALQVSEVICGHSQACSSLEQIVAALSVPSIRYGVAEVKKFLKAPWSGSGKGLRWGASLDDVALRNWCRRVLAAQGHVVVEPIYNKVLDFAMEFRADGQGEVRFIGYSWFDTDANGAYRGNRLLTNERIAGELSAYVATDVLEEVRTRLERMLSAYVGADYEGYLGVDMMICRFAEAPCYRLHPCVEINLRTNMGVVARVLTDRWLAPGSEGKFRIDYVGAAGSLLEDDTRQRHAHPIEVLDGRIREGYLALTPVDEDTRYRASIQVWPVTG